MNEGRQKFPLSSLSSTPSGERNPSKEADLGVLHLVMAFQKQTPFDRHLVLPVGITLIAAGLAITEGMLDWSAGIEG
ncbi:MAG: hypothetical protein ACXWVS_02630 [Hyphomicrobium sp.]